MSTITNFLALALMTSALATQAFSKPAQLSFTSDKGKVTFKAVGNPSALVINGEGKGPDGKLKITSDKVVEGDLRFDLKTLETGLGLRDRHMKNKYLEVEKFPEAKFTPTQVPWTDPSTAGTQNLKVSPFVGKLTLHGVEMPVEGTMSSTAANGKVDCEFDFKIKLTDYKIEIPSFAEITVAETVDVKVKAVAEVTPL